MITTKLTNSPAIIPSKSDSRYFFFWFLTLLILFSAPTNKIVMSMFTHLCRFIRALFRSGHTIPLTLLKYPFLSFEMIDSIFKWKHN